MKCSLEARLESTGPTFWINLFTTRWRGNSLSLDLSLNYYLRIFKNAAYNSSFSLFVVSVAGQDKTPGNFMYSQCYDSAPSIVLKKVQRYPFLAVVLHY